MLERYIAYLKDNPERYWFKRKLYGWGWVPVTWQGWLVVGVWLAAIAILVSSLDENSPPREVAFTFILPLLFLTALLLRICYKKGERPRWQWGFDKDEPPSESK